MKIKIYHNPRCTKSRQALQELENRKLDFEVVEYLKEIPSKAELTEIIELLGISAFDLIRKGEDVYKSEFKGKELTDAQWIEAMIKFPKLIERPIIIHNGKAVVARPLEKMNDIL